MFIAMSVAVFYLSTRLGGGAESVQNAMGHVLQRQFRLFVEVARQKCISLYPGDLIIE